MSGKIPSRLYFFPKFEYMVAEELILKDIRKNAKKKMKNQFFDGPKGKIEQILKWGCAGYDDEFRRITRQGGKKGSLFLNLQYI